MKAITKSDLAVLPVFLKHQHEYQRHTIIQWCLALFSGTLHEPSATRSKCVGIEQDQDHTSGPPLLTEPMVSISGNFSGSTSTAADVQESVKISPSTDQTDDISEASDSSILDGGGEHTISTRFAVGTSESTITGDEQVLPDTTEFESGVKITSTDNSNSEFDSSIQTRDEPHTTRLFHLSDPKRAADLLRVSLPIFGVHFWKRKEESPSIVILVIASLDLGIVFWIYERLDNSNSPNYNMYLCCYKILKDVYYILYVVAFISILLELLTTST